MSGKVVGEQQVQWLLMRIEEQTDLIEFKGMAKRDLAKFASNLIDRIDAIDTICEEFRKRLKTEAHVPRGASHEAMVVQHLEDARNCRRD